MFTRPRLKKSFAIEILEPRLVFLLSEHRQHVFEGESFVRLAPLLDGNHSLADIVSKVGGELPLDAIYATLAQMQKRGCLVEAEGLPDWEHTAFWEHLNADVAAAHRRLSGSPIALRILGEVSSASWLEALENAGLRLEPENASALLVVLTDDYLRAELAEINRNALAAERPWVLAKPVGSSIWVGPLFRPGMTACWKCLERRLSFNRQVEYFLCRRTGRSAPIVTSKPGIASSVDAGIHFAAIELAKSLALETGSGLEDRILTLDLGSLELRQHWLMKRPQCAACGNRSAERAKPVVLSAQPKGSGAGAGEDGRPTSASVTFQRYQHHVSPITGIVTALTSRDPDPYGPTHNFLAAHYFPVLTDDLRILRSNLIARSGGKGLSEIQAKTSALCEALERYSGIAWGEERIVRGSYESLAPQAIHIRDLALFSEAQYRIREELNVTSTSDRHQVPPELANDAEIAWAEAWSLSDERVRYLPAAYCYYGHMDPGNFFTRCDSNGCAAGNSLEEAILHGFLELVERDSVALWWYSRARRPAVDAASFGLPEWDRLARHYDRELKREVHVLDITADLGISAFAVVSRKPAGPAQDVIVGFGTHLSPRAALLKALSEANQYLPAVRDSAPDGSTLYRLFDEETVRWWRQATYENQPYLVPSSDRTRVLADYQDLARDDLKDDVLTCVRACRDRGLEMLVLDQTRPDVELPVAKVVVPSMRHFWRRLAPGRLYDVPVELGWVERRLSESEMNPISCFV
jgi:ribosomal protein S12 methylthiotransferase accessory factor